MVDSKYVLHLTDDDDDEYSDIEPSWSEETVICRESDLDW